MHPTATNLDSIAPISDKQKAEVRDLTLNYIANASQIYRKTFSSIPILFDLSGKCAGMYRRHGSQRLIRFNPWLFSKYYKHSIEQTIPHEVAHYITDCLWPFRKLSHMVKSGSQLCRNLGLSQG